jgi:hypothetical protein
MANTHWTSLQNWNDWEQRAGLDIEHFKLLVER